MIGIHVTMPYASYRRGYGREFRDSEMLPPPSTLVGMLKSLVGEDDRFAHQNCRVTCALLTELTPLNRTVELRKFWKFKKGRDPINYTGMRDRLASPGYQQILTAKNDKFLHYIIWLDSSEEECSVTLEDRVRSVLVDKKYPNRFGNLSLGESRFLVNDISFLDDARIARLSKKFPKCAIFELNDCGTVNLPVWVDHVGSKGTIYAVGNYVASTVGSVPEISKMPKINSST